METPTEPPTVPTRVKRAWTFGIVAGLIVLTVLSAVRESRGDPENVVHDYFAAILDGDTDTALSLMTSQPTSNQNDFLTAEAVSPDWQVVSVEDAGAPADRADSDDLRMVRVEIGGPAGVADGELRVSHSDSHGWQIDQAPLSVTIAPSPLEFIQVNGYTPEPQPTGQANQYLGGRQRVFLLPGMYRFYEDIPGVVKVASSKSYAAMPSGSDDRREPVVTPGKMVPGKKTVASAREQLGRLLRECVETTVARPGNCPFGAGRFVNTSDGEHVRELNDLSWELERMPKFAMLDARFADMPGGGSADRWRFRFKIEDTEVLTLRGKGIDSDDKKTDFEVPCRIDLSGAAATVARNGTVTLSKTSLPGDDSEAMTCGKEL